LGIGDWGSGPIPNPQSPIPNPQSPIIFKKIQENIKSFFLLHFFFILKLIKQINEGRFR